MRWLKRIALFSAALWAFLAVASLYSIYLSRGTPAWYAGPTLSDAQRQAEANETEQRIAELFGYAGDVAAAQRRQLLTPTSRPSALPAPRTITITERQLNAFITKWQDALGFNRAAARANQHFSDARVALLDGHLVIAGTMRDMGILSDTVTSVEFDLSLDDRGRLAPRLNHVYTGRLPVPTMLLQAPQARLTDALEDELNQLEGDAVVGPDGLANGATAEAAAIKLLLAGLTGRDAAPIVLLPCFLGSQRRAVPLWITDLKISDRKLTLTLRPLVKSELWELLRTDTDSSSSRSD